MMSMAISLDSIAKASRKPVAWQKAELLATGPLVNTTIGENEIPDCFDCVTDDQIQDQPMSKAPAHEQKPSQSDQSQQQTDAGA